MNNENYDIYLKDIKWPAPSFSAHNSFITKNNINIDKLFNEDINITNLYGKCIKYNISNTNFQTKHTEFVNSYVITDAIKDSNHFNMGIVPSDPLSAYEKKGRSHTLQEYYNPKSFFSKLHLFSPRETESFVKYNITCPGKINQDELNNKCSQYNIDLIRGWGAYWPVDYIMNLTKIPKVISAHDTREQFIYDNLKHID